MALSGASEMIEPNGWTQCSESAGEPDVVGGGGGPPERVVILIANFEVLEIATGPASLKRHLSVQAKFPKHLVCVLTQLRCGSRREGGSRTETQWRRRRQ